jgi:dTDP-4-dehydrorhamnose reductase
MKETILLTGGSGLLALNWAVFVRDNYNVVLGLHERHIQLPGITSIVINLDSVSDFELILKKLNPVAVIHTAGLTSVEACEANPEIAKYINVSIAENVAKATSSLGIKMVQISTDHLFAGEESFAGETQPIAPCNIYGATKAEAELVVLKANPKALVVRTNFYGWGPAYRVSFSDLIISKLRSKKEVTLFEDVYYSPILAETLIDKVHELMDSGAEGIFNVVSSERISKYSFGQLIARYFELDSKYIIKGLIKDNPGLVKRPKDMSLSNSKVSQILNKKFDSIDDQIIRLREQETLGLITEIKNL